MKEFNRHHFVALEDCSIEASSMSLIRALGYCIFRCNQLKELDGRTPRRKTITFRIPDL